ncbi:MAG: dTMP kinase [Phycisphaerales bacterium]
MTLNPWTERLRGRLIVLDGPDGCGKSTQRTRLVEWLGGAGLEPSEVREPGGTAIGERIREILLDPSCAEMDLRCEMLLYMASRSQLCRERIFPALAAGGTVVSDRFISSTLAYQGTAGGLSFSEIAGVGEVATGGLLPDLTVILDVDDAISASRMAAERDRIEQRSIEFHRRVREGFLEQARRWPDRYAVIAASPSPDVVFEELLGHLQTRSADWKHSPHLAGRAVGGATRC